MTYIHGKHAAEATRIQARIDAEETTAKDLQAAIKLARLKEQNLRSAAALRAIEERTNQIQADMQTRRTPPPPPDPDWKQHRIDADKEMREWAINRRTKNTTRTAVMA